MIYTVRIYDRNTINDIRLEENHRYSIGRNEDADYVLHGDEFSDEQIKFYYEDGKWFVEGKKDVFYSGHQIEKNEIKNGDIYVMGRSTPISIWVFEEPLSVQQRLKLQGTEELTLGRNPKCDIIFNDKKVSGHHARIYKKDSRWYIEDLASTNGTFVNGGKIDNLILNDGDEIDIAIYRIVFEKDTLIIKCSTEFVYINLKTKETMSVNAGNVFPYKEYPYFKRSPRLRKAVPAGEIEIESPPSIGTKPDINWLSVLIPPIGMAAIMVLIVAITGGSRMSIYYTAPMCLLSVCVSVTTYFGQKKKHKQREMLRIKKYEEHLTQKVQEIEEKREEQIGAVTMSNPSVQDCLDTVYNIKRELWERKPGDNDFMSIRLGEGSAEFNMNIRIPKVGIVLDEDDLIGKPGEIKHTYEMIDNFPILLDMAQNNMCGIIGNRNESLKLLRNMLIQVTSHHCYDDVKLVTVYDRKEESYFKWIKWLPHSFDDNKEMRYMADDVFSAGRLFKFMEELLSQRVRELDEEKSLSSSMKLPYYLFIITDRKFIEEQTINQYLALNRPELGIGTIFVFDDLSMLPKECSVIIEASRQQNVIYNKENISEKQIFSIENISDAAFPKYSRSMLPIKTDIGAEEALLPQCVTFLEGYGVRRPEEINLDANWNSGLTYKSMAVPIGVKANGEDFIFDIHEKKYGPHGLVAGMTGSGKSEMVQSWILSMALKFSPEDVSFVLIDFKGTGLILPFLNMPHLAGTISDLDTNINRNLIALENELSRRKALLDEAGVNNISAYLKLYKEGKVKEPLSFLFIVIDEFAEFKVQFPDFMTVVNRVFAIGRTLGVFAILLTQKPAGVVDDKMHANTRFRWCLKVASSIDSKEMLKHPDAAKITNPGRAYVQVGEDEVYELIQSYWSGAPYEPERKNSSSVKPKISIVGIEGNRISYEEKDKSASAKNEKNEIDVIVDYIKEYAESRDGIKARQIWEPKMPDVIPLDKLLKNPFDGYEWHENSGQLKPVIALVDEPQSQKQYPLELDIDGDGHIAVYGAPGTGKTTLLQTLVMSVCMSYTPEAVNIYVMDFGGWSMNIFRDYPHVGGIANDNEAEKISKLANLIKKELDNRKYKFSESGVGNLKSYMEMTGEKLPYILLMVDNFAPVLNLYPELEPFFVTLTREGGNYGIYFITTASNTMALGFKLAQNIKMAIALQMADRGEYSSIVGKTNGLEPENCEGRGLVKGNPPLEIQVALPAEGTTESERIAEIKKIGEEMSRIWTGKVAKPIPVMPEIIQFRNEEANGIMLGLSTEEVEPVYTDFKGSHYIAVSGTAGSGKSNMLQVIAKQFYTENMIVYDTPDKGLNGLRGLCNNYIETKDAFDKAIKELMPLLQERRDAYLEDSNKEFTPVLIVVDDWNSCFETAGEDTVRRIDAIIRLGKGLNVNLLVGVNCDDIKSLSNKGESVSMGLIKSSTAVLLGGSLNDHSCFKVNVPYNETGTVLGEFEGYYVEKNKPVRFKAMCKD